MSAGANAHASTWQTHESSRPDLQHRAPPGILIDGKRFVSKSSPQRSYIANAGKREATLRPCGLDEMRISHVRRKRK